MTNIVQNPIFSTVPLNIFEIIYLAIGLFVCSFCYYTAVGEIYFRIPSLAIFITVAVVIYLWLKTLAKPLSQSLPDGYYEFMRSEESFAANKWYVKTLSFNKETHKVCKLSREDMIALAPMWPHSMLRKKHLDEYFFGYLDQASVSEIIRENGQFILGMNDQPNDKRCVLWFVWSNTLNRLPIDKIKEAKNSLYSIEKGKKFDTIGELVEYYSVKSNRFPYQSPFDIVKEIWDVKLANYRTSWKPKIKENTYVHYRLLTFTKKMQKKPVFFAFLKNSRSLKEKKSIVKASSKEADVQQMQKSSMDEYRTARMFKHENVVNVLGIVVDTIVPLLVFERGEMDLNNFAYYYDIPLLFKLKLLLDVAKGMNHLIKMGVLHNDLCGHNVVIFRNDRTSDVIAKLIDFDRALPQSRESYFTDLGQLDDVPVRRMSPEVKIIFSGRSGYTSAYSQVGSCTIPVINMCTTIMGIHASRGFNEALMRKGSEKSDVWEYGVMMWEIFTDGAKPFEEISDETYIGDLIINGSLRLEPPPVPIDVKSFIQSCWTKSVSLRPQFSQLVYRLKVLMHSTNTFCENINAYDEYSQWTQIFTYTVSNWMCHSVISNAKRYNNMNKPYSVQAAELSSLMKRLTGNVWCCIVGEKFNYASMPMTSDVISLSTSSLKIFMFSQPNMKGDQFPTKQN